MFVYWKDRVPAGSSSDVPVTMLDFYPTFLEIAGIERPAGKVLDGENILPLFTGKGEIETRPLFWHFPVYLQAYMRGGRPDARSPFPYQAWFGGEGWGLETYPVL
jgi:arylsulfatase A-like enzyme